MTQFKYFIFLVNWPTGADKLSLYGLLAKAEEMREGC